MSPLNAVPRLIQAAGKAARMLGLEKTQIYKSAKTAVKTKMLSSRETASYWTKCNVTAHQQFNSVEESLENLSWRNSQYYNYIELMPVSGQNGKSVLDFGCGPGNDLVGFGVYSKPRELVGIDISSSSLAEAGARLKLHGISAKLIQLEPSSTRLPFEDASFDHIHSSGVIHHVPDPVMVLRELRRVIRPGGTMNVMVYNHNSIWFHLYVAYMRSIVAGMYPELSLKDQFARSTDGETCPISNCYKPEEWISICDEAGFAASFAGAAIALSEAYYCSIHRLPALLEQRLPKECRDFLTELEFDKHGFPMYKGAYAGIDA